MDEKENRYITPEEEAAFFGYILERWQGWRLPVLFYTVKGLLGCRILQLCSAKSIDLRSYATLRGMTFLVGGWPA